MARARVGRKLLRQLARKTDAELDDAWEAVLGVTSRLIDTNRRSYEHIKATVLQPIVAESRRRDAAAHLKRTIADTKDRLLFRREERRLAKRERQLARRRRIDAKRAQIAQRLSGRL